MSLHINSREHLKQRQEVKPLTMEEEEALVRDITIAFLYEAPLDIDDISMLQRLIYNYENYKHFFIISQSKTADMEVVYIEVESKMNDNG